MAIYSDFNAVDCITAIRVAIRIVNQKSIVRYIAPVFPQATVTII